MLNTLKNTAKTTTRFAGAKNTIIYTIKTLQLRAEKERLERIKNEVKDREQKELIEEQIKQHTVMCNVYKDAALRAMKSALD